MTRKVKMHLELKVELADENHVVQPVLDRLNQLSKAMAAETDRGVAIVGDAVMDELLAGVFRKRLLNDWRQLKRTMGKSSCRQTADNIELQRTQREEESSAIRHLFR
jgi:hypothetical protein